MPDIPDKNPEVQPSAADPVDLNKKAQDKRMQEIWPSQMDDKQLVDNRIRVFAEDARWREQCVGSDGFNQALKLYEPDGWSGLTVSSEHGTSAAGTQIPEVNHIRKAVDDAVSVSLSNTPKTRLVSSEPIPADTPDDVKLILQNNLQVTQETMNRLCDTKMSRQRYVSKRSKAELHAGIFGFGVLRIESDGVVDVRKSFQARELLAKQLGSWGPSDYALYEKLYCEVKIECEDSRDFFFMRGVRRHDADEMLRVSTIKKRNLHKLRALYPDQAKDITAGRSPYFVEPNDNDSNSNDDGEVVSVLTTWEIEVYPETRQIQNNDGQVMSSVSFDNARLIKTIIAGRALLYKEVWDGSNKPIALPFVVRYILESEKHPYGYPLTRQLQVLQKFINAMYTLIYQQGANSISPTSFAILTKLLSKHDDPQVMYEKLRRGEPIFFEGNEDTERITDIIQPVSYASGGMNSGIGDILGMAIQNFQSLSMMPDAGAVGRAESGSAKRTEIAVADRGKTRIIDLNADAEEAAKYLMYQWIRATHKGEKLPVTIKQSDGAPDESVLLNQPDMKPLPIRDDRGRPVVNPFFTSPDNPEGYAFTPVIFERNSVMTDLHAEAEGRGVLPLNWESRIVALTSLLQSGILQSAKTARDLGLPDEIIARDDFNAQREKAAYEQNMQMLTQMGLSPNVIPQLANGGGGGGNNAQAQLAQVAGSQTMMDTTGIPPSTYVG